MVNFTSRVSGHITIGAGVDRSFAVSGGCYVQALNGVIINDGTIFGPGVKIISSNHDRTNLDRKIPTRPIVIGSKCWIGANAVILAGVELGDRVVVAAGAVVTKCFPSDSVIGGVPARAISKAVQE